MANNLTNLSEDRMLDWLLVVGSPTRPTSPLKVVLYTSAPNQETGSGGTEVSGGSYARTNVTFGSSSGGASSNTADVTFPTATASWGTITSIGIVDSAGSPVLLWVGPLTASKTIDDGDTFKINTGALGLTLD